LEIVIAACVAVASAHVNAPIHISVRTGICVAPPSTMAMTLQRRNGRIRSRQGRFFGKNWPGNNPATLRRRSLRRCQVLQSPVLRLVMTAAA